MNSEKLLDDFDVVFTIVVNKIYIRRNSFSFIGKMYRIAVRCLYTYGSADLLEPPCNFLGSVSAYPATESPHGGMSAACFLWGVWAHVVADRAKDGSSSISVPAADGVTRLG